MAHCAVTGLSRGALAQDQDQQSARKADQANLPANLEGGRLSIRIDMHEPCYCLVATRRWHRIEHAAIHEHETASRSETLTPTNNRRLIERATDSGYDLTDVCRISVVGSSAVSAAGFACAYRAAAQSRTHCHHTFRRQTGCVPNAPCRAIWRCLVPPAFLTDQQ